MSQPDAKAEQRLQVALAALTPGVSAAQVARQFEVSEASVAKWKRQFVDGGARALGALGSPATRVAELESEVRTLRKSLHEARLLLEAWRRSSDNQVGRLTDLDTVRREARISVVSFCTLVGVPRRTYYRYLDKAKMQAPAEKARRPAQPSSTPETPHHAGSSATSRTTRSTVIGIAAAVADVAGAGGLQRPRRPRCCAPCAG